MKDNTKFKLLVEKDGEVVLSAIDAESIYGIISTFGDIQEAEDENKTEVSICDQARDIAQKTIIDLAENGGTAERFEASKYILNNLGNFCL